MKTNFRSELSWICSVRILLFPKFSREKENCSGNISKDSLTSLTFRQQVLSRCPNHHGPLFGEAEMNARGRRVSSAGLPLELDSPSGLLRGGIARLWERLHPSRLTETLTAMPLNFGEPA